MKLWGIKYIHNSAFLKAMVELKYFLPLFTPQVDSNMIICGFLTFPNTLLTFKILAEFCQFENERISLATNIALATIVIYAHRK